MYVSLLYRPASLLSFTHPCTVTWFSLITLFRLANQITVLRTKTWCHVVSSMYPLLVKDGLVLPCWALAGIFYFTSSYHKWMKQPKLTVISVRYCIVYQLLLISLLSFSLQCASSLVGLLILCAAGHVIPPPSHLPHLFPVLISGYSCILLLLFWLHLTVTQLYSKQRSQLNKHIMHERIKNDWYGFFTYCNITVYIANYNFIICYPWTHYIASIFDRKHFC